MSGIVRSVGQIASFAVGTLVNKTYGGAIGSILFGLLVPTGTTPAVSTAPSDTLNEGAEPGTVLPKIYGLYPVKGMLIDCGFNSDGEAAGVVSSVKTKKKGGFFGIGGTKVQTRTDRLKAAFALAEGPFYAEQIRVDYGDGNGEVVEYDRYNEDDDEMPNPIEDPEGWRDFLVSQFDGSAPYRPGKGVQFIPQYAPDGTLIAELSQTLRLYHGTEWQEPDTALAEIHGSQVCAYVGQSYVMWNGWDMKGSTMGITYYGRNLVDNSGAIVRERFQVCGTPRERIKITSLSKRIEGCAIAQVEGVRDLIEKIAALEFHDLMFLDGGFQDASRINPATWVLRPEQLGARLVSDGEEVTPSLQWNQKGARELITCLRLKYLNIDNDYEEDEAVALRQVAGHDNELTLDFPFASRPIEMVRLVDVMMDELWAGNATETVTLLQSEPRIAPANVLIYDAGDGIGTRQLRITRQPNSGMGGLLNCEGVLYDPGVYGRHRIVDPAPKPRPTVISYPAPDFALFDMPSLSSETQSTAQLIFAASNLDGLPYAGAFFESSSLGEETEVSRAALGTLLTNIDFDESECRTFQNSTFRIQLDSQALTTVDDDAAGLGANLLAIQTVNGALLVSVRTAIPVTGQPRQWDITRHLPARFGTERFGTITAGARCVLLTDPEGEQRAGLDPIAVPLAKIGQAQPFEVSALLDPTKTSGLQNVTPQGRSLRPATVANLTLTADGAGGVNLQFLPRTRDWESAMAYWQTGQAPRETDPRRFTLVLRSGTHAEVSRRAVSFSDGDDLPLQIHLTSSDLTGVTSGEIWQEGAYLSGDKRSFEF